MIFIKPEDNQSIFISKHNKAEAPFTLILIHNLSNEEYKFENLTDHGYRSSYLIFSGLDFRYLQSGEYKYSVIDNSGYQKEAGLLQVMAKLEENISYKKDNQTIIYGK